MHINRYMVINQTIQLFSINNKEIQINTISQFRLEKRYLALPYLLQKEEGRYQQEEEDTKNNKLPPSSSSVMEFFTKAKEVRLKSHLDKYLCAEEDQKTVRQSRNGSSSKVRWTVEILQSNNNHQTIRLKSCYGLYLTASEEPFLLGMTGQKVIQSASAVILSSLMSWEPIRDGFQVKLRTSDGKFLRANGSTPPWRNSITHDKPSTGATKNWLLWDVEMVGDDGLPRIESSIADYRSQVSSLSSEVDDLDSPSSAWSIASSPMLSSAQQLGMEMFRNAKAIRLRSHHDKYLLAEEDEESVTQDRNGSSKTARWTVEFIRGPGEEEGDTFIRLKSCFGKYLTASNLPFLLGMTGRKVLQTLPRKLDSSLEWEPIRDSHSHRNQKVKLKTRYGNFLRANGGVPPWRNSLTHDVPHRTSTQDWILWDVDVLEIQVQVNHKTSFNTPSAPPEVAEIQSQPPSPTQSQQSEPATPRSRTSSFNSFKSSFKWHDSSATQKMVPDGRTIYFSIAVDEDDIDNNEEGSFIFKGNGVDELTQKLEEEIGMADLIVCTRSPLNRKLYPLRLQLPPNNATMHVVLVPSSSNVARDFAK